MTTTLSPVTSPTERAPLSPALRLGPVTVAVADRNRSLAFYRDFLGLTLLNEDTRHGEPTLTLGAGDEAVLRLIVRPGVSHLPRNVTGLYHAAILLPSRVALARIIVRLAEARYPFGASDHAVSEALYLDDPDGNGLEIYWDRRREEWPWRGGQIQVTTLPLDLESVASELSDDESRWAAMPAGTTLGHMHLRVGDAEVAERFYADVLGFDIMASFPGARFMSVAGYHHHLGTNSWESANGRPRSDDTAGLIEWEIVLPDTDALESVASRLATAGVATDARADGSLDVLDPWATRLVLRAA